MNFARHNSAAATLNSIGVFIVGGRESNNPRTSEFLAAGKMQWQEGPGLPVDMTFPRAVAITSTSFLAIHGTDIREFDTAIAGPTRDGERQGIGHHSKQAGPTIQDVPRSAKKSS